MNEKSDRGSHGDGSDKASANRQASEWLVLLESGDATEEDRARFEAWLAEDPRHREAYAALTETWGRLTAMGRRARAGAMISPGEHLSEGHLNLPRRARRRSYAPVWAAGAAVLVAAVLGSMVLISGDSAVPYRTDIGERRTVSLTDGSMVQLNTNTELIVAYTRGQRRVSMTRGEAFFDVAGDADRPFIVTAGRGIVRAVGTRFTVRLESPDLVSVMVTEGLIELVHLTGTGSGASPPPPALEPPVLRRGQRAEYDDENTRIRDVTPAEIERTQAWRRGLLVFEDASLAEIIAEVNRYTDKKIVLAEPAIGDLRLGGTFKTGRTEALLNVLEKSFGIRASHENPNTISLQVPTDSAD